MFFDNASRVLNGHIPTAEIDHLAAKFSMSLI
jgi:hypothetical protein